MSSKGKISKRSTRNRKDPKAPKKALSAWILFSTWMRPKVKEEYPTLKLGEQTKMVSEKWKALSSEEKKVWEMKAVEDKKRYEKELEEYKSSKKAEDEVSNSGSDE